MLNLLLFGYHERWTPNTRTESGEDINYKFHKIGAFYLSPECVCALSVDLLRAIVKSCKCERKIVAIQHFVWNRKSVWITSWRYKWHRRIKHLSRSLCNNHGVCSCSGSQLFGLVSAHSWPYMAMMRHAIEWIRLSFPINILYPPIIIHAAANLCKCFTWLLSRVPEARCQSIWQIEIYSCDWHTVYLWRTVIFIFHPSSTWSQRTIE